MYSTREVLRHLREANPEQDLTEEQIRRTIRDEAIAPPGTFAGRLAWTVDDVHALATALDLKAPALHPAESRS